MSVVEQIKAKVKTLQDIEDRISIGQFAVNRGNETYENDKIFFDQMMQERWIPEKDVVAAVQPREQRLKELENARIDIPMKLKELHKVRKQYIKTIEETNYKLHEEVEERDKRIQELEGYDKEWKECFVETESRWLRLRELWNELYTYWRKIDDADSAKDVAMAILENLGAVLEGKEIEK